MNILGADMGFGDVREKGAIPPRRHSRLVVRPMGNAGQYVIKDPLGGAYFTVGEQECFLFEQLDGERSVEEILAAFQGRFGESISEEELQGFVATAQSRGLVETDRADEPGAEAGTRDALSRSQAPLPATKSGRRSTAPYARSQNLLYFHVSLFDPDRLFDWLEPKIRACWTRAFCIVSLIGLLAALMIVVANRHEIISRFPNALNWHTVAAVWFTIALVTAFHECAHGLTCKHYGGEVHEMGFLLIFLIPSFFCNVSDAWLFREKSKRLCVGLAGIYCDLCVWAIAVFAWRISVQNGLINYLAWVLLSVCGARMFFNLNPLLKLDGYYIASDGLDIPNLSGRGQSRLFSLVRWVLWGAPRPTAEPRGRLIACYGAASWCFILGLLGLMFLGLLHFLSATWGAIGLVALCCLFLPISYGLFSGFTAGEVKTMIVSRRKRTVLWVFGLGALVAALFLEKANDRVGGTFQVRPKTRTEIRAPEAGFLRDVGIDEGAHASPGTVVARIDIPDLESSITKKQAELRESSAILRRVEAGPRPEEIADQRLRVERFRAWRNLAKQDLARTKQAQREEVLRLDQLVSQSKMEVDYCKQAADASEKLFKQQAMSEDQYLAERKKFRIAESQWQQAMMQKHAREAAGNLEAEAELARREKELADVEAALSMLQVGARPEEIEAERAHLDRLQEELRYLEDMRKRVVLHSPATGLITTPRMKEKNGQYFEKGAVICVVEDISGPEVEIAMAEDDEASVQAGQLVTMKARALPFSTFEGRVERKAPSAVPGEGHTQSTVTVYCRLESSSDGALLPGMTGYARVYCGSRSIGLIIGRRLLQYLRTEFWW